MKRLALWLAEPLYRWITSYLIGAGLLLRCSDSPDTSGMNRAAELSAQVSREALDWFKGEYDRTRPEREAATRRAFEISDAQLAQMRTVADDARRLSERNRTVFQPMEDRIIADAQGYDTALRRADAAASAMADVDRSFAATQQAANRALARTGVAPGGAKSMAMLADVALEQAKARAGAGTQAERNVEQQGYARRMDAVGLGKGIVGNQATMQSVATQTGNSSVAAAGSGNATGMSGAGLMQTGYNQALQGQQIAGNLYGQAAQIRAQSDGGFGSFLGGVGGIMQGIGSIWSSKKLKHKKGDADARQALEAIEKLDNDTWKYREGVQDEGVHIGPYAEDVQKHLGDQVAPAGVQINVAEMGRVNKKAIAALAHELKSLEAELRRLEEDRA